MPARRIDIGLPERADLLASLAAGQSPWRRLELVLVSIALPRTLALASAALLGTLCGLLLLSLARARRAALSSSALPPA